MREILEDGVCLNVLIRIYLGVKRWVINPCKMQIANVQALQVDRLVFYTFHLHSHLHHLSTTRDMKPTRSIKWEIHTRMYGIFLREISL